MQNLARCCQRNTILTSTRFLPRISFPLHLQFEAYNSASRNSTRISSHNRSHFGSLKTSTMSFSNTSTGDKPADPYKEKNLDRDAGTKEKVEDVTNFISSCKFGMMTTRIADSGLLVSRCMAVAAKENGVDLLFHTNTESGKTSDLDSDSHVNVSFLNPTGEWASVSGTSKIITDPSFVEKYYSPSLKTWLGDLGDGKHDGGPQDPRIGVIKVEAKTITYAIARSNAISRGVEMVTGAITGNAAQVNKLREISEEEIKEYRARH